MENTNLVNRLKQLTKRKQQRSHARSALASISNGTKMPSTMRIFCEKETLPISTGSLATCVSSDTIKIDEFLSPGKPKGSRVTPFRLEAQQNIRDLRHRAEVSRRRKEICTIPNVDSLQHSPAINNESVALTEENVAIYSLEEFEVRRDSLGFGNEKERMASRCQRHSLDIIGAGARDSLCSLNVSSIILPAAQNQLWQERNNHCVFGKLLVDLGYKQLYLSSARSIVANVPIWNLQRPVDHDRVKDIVRAKNGLTSFPGSISIFNFEDLTASGVLRQKCGIFDGQHRLVAIAEMLEDGTKPDFQMTVEVFPVTSEEDIKALFLELNKSEKVLEIDLPDTLAPQEKQIIDEAVHALQHQFRAMFKPSQNCRVPHVNAERMRNDLHLHRYVQRNNIFTPVDLVAKLNDVNSKILDAFDSCNERASYTQLQLSKAQKHGFFLGLNKEWLKTPLCPK
jgi:hypothetical protein